MWSTTSSLVTSYLNHLMWSGRNLHPHPCLHYLPFKLRDGTRGMPSPALDRGESSREITLIFARRESASPRVKIPKPSHAPSTSGTATTQNFSTIHCHQLFQTNSLGCFCLQTNPTLLFFYDASMKSFSNSPPLSNYFCVICLVFGGTLSPLSLCPTRQYILRVISTSLLLLASFCPEPQALIL